MLLYFIYYIIYLKYWMINDFPLFLECKNLTELYSSMCTILFSGTKMKIIDLK